MKILITGVNGQVGHALMQELTEHELIGLKRQDCDLSNPDQIRHVIDQHQPDLVINPAAYTKVDQAEEEPELAFKINRDAPRVMAEKAREYHIPLIHFSTDYVFDGEKKGIPILSVLGVLNDDYEGGEFIIFDDTEIKFDKGDVLVFPSLFLYPHKVEPVKSGTRYSYISWVH